MSSRIDHVAFQVGNIEKAVEWYVSNVGANIIKQDKDWAMLDVYGCKLALTLPFKHPYHMAILCKDISEFPSEHGIETHRDGSMFLYCTDPFGNAVEWIYYPETKDI